jgi:hypothetical protein
MRPLAWRRGVTLEISSGPCFNQSLRNLLEKLRCAQRPGINNSLVDYHGKEWNHWRYGCVGAERADRNNRFIFEKGTT